MVYVVSALIVVRHSNQQKMPLPLLIATSFSNKLGKQTNKQNNVTPKPTQNIEQIRQERIIECFELEDASKGHVVQTAVSRDIFNEITESQNEFRTYKLLIDHE